MNSRQVEILRILCEDKKTLTLTDLSKQLDVSLRTIQNDFEVINYELGQNQVGSLKGFYKKGKGILLDSSKRQDLSTYLGKPGQLLDNPSPEERATLMYLYLLLGRQHITINELCERFKVSKGTVLNDLDRIKRYISEKDIIMSFSQRLGFHLEGSEDAIRDVGVEHYLEFIKSSSLFGAEDYHRVSICNKATPTFSIEDSFFLFEEGMKLSKAMGRTMTSRDFLMVMCYLEVSLVRMSLGMYIKVSRAQLELIKSSSEFHAISPLLKSCSERFEVQFNDNETAFIASKLLASSIVSSSPSGDNENYADIQMLACSLIRAVEKEIGLDFSQDLSMYNDLVLDLRPAIYRISSGMHHKNPLLEDIKNTYPEILTAVIRSSSLIQDVTKQPVSEDEAAYITLHFAAAAEKQRSRSFKTPTVLIVCDSGIGTSNLLSARLSSIYDVNIAGTAAIYEVQEALKNTEPDYILSTISLKLEDKRVLQVSPMISEQDMKTLDIYFHRKHISAVNQNKLLEIISRSCTIHNREQLIKDLGSELSIALESHDNKQTYSSLKEVMKEDMVSLDYSAENWEAAVREAGRLLLEGGCIDQAYIEDMISSVKALGGYIVICKGIALPHSRSGKHVNKIGISFLRLKEPVEFGNDENDPVDMVFALSSVDNKSHIHALRDLSKALSQEKTLKLLRNAKTPKRVLELLTNK
jgi:transcriptional antiterminator/mannitol/fructose-specific phosphotransferase system IIA component